MYYLAVGSSGLKQLGISSEKYYLLWKQEEEEGEILNLNSNFLASIRGLLYSYMIPLQAGYVRFKSKIFGLWSHTIKIGNKLYKHHVLHCATTVGLIGRCQGGILWILGRERGDRMKVLKRQGCTLGKMCKELLTEEGAIRQRKIQAKSTAAISHLPSSSPSSSYSEK